MISFFQKLSNVEVKIIGADISGILTELCYEDILVSHTEQIDEYELVLYAYEKDIARLRQIVTKCGGEIVSFQKSLLKHSLERLNRHSIILYFLSACIFLFWFLPTRIIFIDIVGNQNLDTIPIRSVCYAEGLRPGVKRREIRSEQIKNALIGEFPQIRWAGVNTYGAHAIVSIEENANKSTEKQSVPCDIVAGSDGKIQSIEVKEGTTRFRTGDSVNAGDVLISGQMDVGLCTLNMAAAGEIYAETYRYISSLIPKTVKIISADKREMHSISFNYQNFKIKLPFSSGISGTTCGRISKEYFLRFPGGFKLPVSLIIDSYVPYESSVEELSVQTAEDDLTDFSDSFISESMVAGKIKSVNRQTSIDENIYRMDGIYCCHEMIGRTKAYEIGDVYGKNN